MKEQDIDLLEQFWIEKSRKNFFAYRQFLRANRFQQNWFVAEICQHLQQFYLDYKAGNRPILLLQTPPQHGKSLALIDFISWVFGQDNTLKIIFSSFSDMLGMRANKGVQRALESGKYQKIFRWVRQCVLSTDPGNR